MTDPTLTPVHFGDLDDNELLAVTVDVAQLVLQRYETLTAELAGEPARKLRAYFDALGSPGHALPPWSQRPVTLRDLDTAAVVAEAGSAGGPGEEAPHTR